MLFCYRYYRGIFWYFFRKVGLNSSFPKSLAWACPPLFENCSAGPRDFLLARLVQLAAHSSFFVFWLSAEAFWMTYQTKTQILIAGWWTRRNFSTRVYSKICGTNLLCCEASWENEVRDLFVLRLVTRLQEHNLVMADSKTVTFSFLSLTI